MSAEAGPWVGDGLPLLHTAVPGPRSEAWVDRLAQRECPAITARRSRRAAALGAVKDDPIVWAEAHGANVIDVDGNRFIDMTAGFGVASVGHGHPAVVSAMQRQAGLLLHAMGDAFPDPRRIELMEALCARTGMDRVIFGSSGSDAIEAALKTARMATGRDGILSFSGAYHGLSYGALAADGYKEADFRRPFEGQLGRHAQRAPFGAPIEALTPLLPGVGAVVVEPIQGRGGVRVPPAGWLGALIDAAHEAGAVVIFDEIYTGLGRTGAWTRAAQLGLEPDLICLGKGLAGGYPISACLGAAAVMDAWGASKGEALHTQTFLGNPVGSAMALACLGVLDEVLPTVEPKGARLRAALESRGYAVQGSGLLLGVRLSDTLRASRGLMERGFLVLPAGEQAEVLALTPPLTITDAQLAAFVDALVGVAPASSAGMHRDVP